MLRKCFVCYVFLFLVFSAVGFAQDEDQRSVIDYKVNKMKQELNLTETQADAIRPIIKDYMTQRETLLREVAGEGIVDHVAVKDSLKALRETEHQKLSKILSSDQMKEWINKETIAATLNPDSPENADDGGAGLNGSGVDFKF